MSVSYTRLIYSIIERNITNAQLMREVNIIVKIKYGRHMPLK